MNASLQLHINVQMTGLFPLRTESHKEVNNPSLSADYGQIFFKGKMIASARKHVAQMAAKSGNFLVCSAQK